MEHHLWFTAVTSGNVEEISALIAAGADLNAKNDKGQTALHVAVLKCGLFDTEAPLVSTLLNAGADKDAKLEGGWTPLHLAIANGRTAAVSALLAHRPQLEVWDKQGRTPLHLAAEKRDPKMPQIIRELLAAGADKNARTRGVGATPLHVAAFFGLPAIIEILLEAGADQKAKNKYGSTALEMAKEEAQKGHEGCAAAVALLSSAGSKKKTSILQRLFAARKSQTTEITAPTLPQPAGVSEPDTASILEAAKRGDLPTVKQLLQAKSALVSCKDSKGDTPLHDAARYGHKDVVELLLAHNAEINTKGFHGNTPLHVAAREHHKEIVELLLAHNAEVNAKDKYGGTPLHDAAGGGHLDVVALLLANQANVNAMSVLNWTPLHAASGKGHGSVVELLVANGAEVNGKSTGKGWTPLHAAADGGHRGVVELLLAKNSDVNARGDLGETPLDLAVIKGQAEVAQLLRQRGGKEARFTSFAEKVSRGPATCEVAIAEWPSLYEALSAQLMGSGIAARQVVELVDERLIGVCPVCRVLSPGKGLQMINLMRQSSVFVGAPADAYRLLGGHCRTESCSSRSILIFWKPDEDREAIARLAGMGIVVRPKLSAN
jgi:ankyrin repeat protein